jgi:hypothetical protein
MNYLTVDVKIVILKSGLLKGRKRKGFAQINVDGIGGTIATRKNDCINMDYLYRLFT